MKGREMQKLLWRHKIKLPAGVTAGDWDQPHLEEVVRRLGDLSGKSVLDVGTLDGKWTFELEERGAKLTSIDATILPTYLHAHSALGSSAEFFNSTVETFVPEKRFDLVWFCGVYYHVPDPIGAIRRLHEFSDTAVIEGHVLGDEPSRLVESWINEVYPTDDGIGVTDISLIPSPHVLVQWVQSCGWEIKSIVHDRFAKRLALICSAGNSR